MDIGFYFSVAKIKSVKQLTGAFEHNKREMQRESKSIDSSKSYLNYALPENKTVMQVQDNFKKLITEANITKFRSNCVYAVEVLISLSYGAEINQQSFYKDTYEWFCEFYKVPILSFDIHNDENCKHCHILLLPIVDNKMKGSDLVGNRRKILAAKNSFFNKVAKKYGLKPASEMACNVNLVKEKLFKLLENDSINNSCAWNCVKRLIDKNPNEFLELLKNDENIITT
jgi:hypothetical protein